MELDISDEERAMFDRLVNGEVFMTPGNGDLLRTFAVKVMSRDKVHQFNSKMINLKEYMQTELPDGCYGICCDDCILMPQRTSCNLREFIGMVRKMEE